MKMKIGQIAKLSKIPTTTIHYYVKQGLLDAPEKINKRICLYDESVIERLRLIQGLQEKRFPLFSIKKILARLDQGISLEEAQTVENIVFGLPANNADELIDRKSYMEQTGLTAKELEELDRHGLLMPFRCEKGKSLYDQDDVAVGKSVFKHLCSLGVPVKEIKFYITLGRQITEKELKLRRKVTSGMTAKENATVTVEMANNAILCRSYFLRRLFQRKVKEKADGCRTQELVP